MCGVLELFRTRAIHGVEQVTAGRRVLGVLPTTAHCYRVGSTLIDAGPPNLAGRVVDHLGDGIEHVVLTHHHEDHVGAAPLLGSRGATVYAPEASLAPLADPPDLLPYQVRVWGKPEPVEAEPLGERVSTPDLTLEVVPTPGHSRDHVSFLEPERGWLFGGDAHVGEREILRSCERLDLLLEDLETLSSLDVDVLFPGHGSVRDDPVRAIQDLHRHYEDLVGRARPLATSGRDARGIRSDLLGPEGFIRYYTRGDFSKQNLAAELLGTVDTGS